MGGPPATAQYAHATLTRTLTLSRTLTLPLTLTLTPGELKWVAGRSGKAGPTPFKELRPPTLQAPHPHFNRNGDPNPSPNPKPTPNKPQPEP